MKSVMKSEKSYLLIVAALLGLSLVIRAFRNHMLRGKAYGVWTKCSIWLRSQLFAG